MGGELKTVKTFCKTCKVKLEGKLKVVKMGYTRSDCRLCLNKKSYEHGKRKAEIKKKYPLW